MDLSFEEVSAFCGNCIELRSADSNSRPKLAVSRRAERQLSAANVATLAKFVDVVVCDVDVMEHVGGGGIRCMIAGIHLPEATD